MSDKETVLELLKHLPATVSFHDIVREIEIIASVKKDLANDIDQERQAITAWGTTEIADDNVIGFVESWLQDEFGDEEEVYPGMEVAFSYE